jgi:hypothetical protein
MRDFNPFLKKMCFRDVTSIRVKKMCFIPNLFSLASLHRHKTPILKPTRRDHREKKEILMFDLVPNLSAVPSSHRVIITLCTL